MTLRQQPVQQNTLYRRDIMPDLSQSVCLFAWCCRWERLCHMSIRKIGQAQECVPNHHFLFLYMTMLPSVCRRSKIHSLSQRRTKANSSVSNFLFPGEVMCDTSGTKQSGKATRSRLVSSTIMNRQEYHRNVQFLILLLWNHMWNHKHEPLWSAAAADISGEREHSAGQTHIFMPSARVPAVLRGIFCFTSFITHLFLCLHVTVCLSMCARQAGINKVVWIWKSYLGESKHLKVSHIKCASSGCASTIIINYYYLNHLNQRLFYQIANKWSEFKSELLRLWCNKTSAK